MATEAQYSTFSNEGEGHIVSTSPRETLELCRSHACVHDPLDHARDGNPRGVPCPIRWAHYVRGVGTEEGYFGIADPRRGIKSNCVGHAVLHTFGRCQNDVKGIATLIMPHHKFVVVIVCPYTNKGVVWCLYRARRRLSFDADPWDVHNWSKRRARRCRWRHRGAPQRCCCSSANH